MLMDADDVILLGQCLSYRYMPVCSFTFGFLGQGRDQRSWSAKIAKFLEFCTLYVFKRKNDRTQRKF